MGNLVKAETQEALHGKVTAVGKVLGLIGSAMVVVIGEIWMESSARDKYISVILLYRSIQ